jgi:hypothetical protein
MSQAFAAGDDAGEGGLFNHELRRLHSSETVNLQTLAAGAPAVLVVNTAVTVALPVSSRALKRCTKILRRVGSKSLDFRLTRLIKKPIARRLRPIPATSTLV